MKPPSEDSEQIALVTALRLAKLYFVHVPMGGARARGSGAVMRRLGARKGFPDVLIFDPPPNALRKAVSEGGRQPPGVAIELKRADGGRGASQEQQRELAKLAKRGWLTAVCNGCAAAVEQLRAWGYEL